MTVVFHARLRFARACAFALLAAGCEHDAAVGGGAVGGRGGAAGVAAIGGEGAAGNTEPGTGAARYPDACPDRSATRQTPCSADPDPCDLHSGFPGDEYCLLPPPADQGFQLHFGPSNYTDAVELAPYIVRPGQEFTSYGVLDIPATAQRQFAYVKLSLRPGSHHLINTLVSGQLTPGFVTASAACGGQLLASFPSTTAPILEEPPQGVPAPENEGLAHDLPDGASLCVNYHRINQTDQTALTEAWINVWFIDPSEVTQRAYDITIDAGPLNPIAAHSSLTLSASGFVNGQGRIVSLFGHRHAASGRFAVFLNQQLVYDTYDWSEPRRYDFDSLTTNPPLGVAEDGAASGVLAVKDGDQIEISCQVQNQTGFALTFGNDLNTEEMCVLFLSAVGVGVNPAQ